MFCFVARIRLSHQMILVFFVRRRHFFINYSYPVVFMYQSVGYVFGRLKYYLFGNFVLDALNNIILGVHVHMCLIIIFYINNLFQVSSLVLVSTKYAKNLVVLFNMEQKLEENIL